MKCHIPEISWHNREPVLSVDFQRCNGDIRRLATAGVDKHVLIWFVKHVVEGAVDLEFVADLVRHDHSVNIVRFSPNGELLASGDDDGQIFIWKKSDKGPISAPNIFKDADIEEKENWTSICNLRGHVKDVHDLSWSPDGNFLVSGSVDNSAILWNVPKSQNHAILSEHKGFVQGVTWDPLDQLVATLCSDRCCRIYNVKTCRVIQKIYKSALPSNNSENPSTKNTRLFHDDTLKSFCRRLTFTPDGELLIVPSGIVENDNENYTNVTYVFSRHNFVKPVMYFPTKGNYTTVVRCCPLLFHLRSKVKDDEKTSSETKPWEVNTTMFKLPYRMVFAVATQSAVFLYDTQQRTPFAHVSNMHFTGLSDMSWSDDGRILIVSSTDGYCSFITFNENELGVPFKEDVSKYLSVPEKPRVKSPEVLKEKKVKIASSASMLPIAKPTNVQPLQNKKRVSLITLFSPKLKSSIQVTSKGPTQGENAAVEGNTRKSDDPPVKKAKMDDDIIEIIYENKKDTSTIPVGDAKSNQTTERASAIPEPMETDDKNSNSKMSEGYNSNASYCEKKIILGQNDKSTNSSHIDASKNRANETAENTIEIVGEKKTPTDDKLQISESLSTKLTCMEKTSEYKSGTTSDDTEILLATFSNAKETVKNLSDSNAQNVIDMEGAESILNKTNSGNLKADISGIAHVPKESSSARMSPLKPIQPQDCFSSPSTTKAYSSSSTKCSPSVTKTPRRVPFITLSTPPKPRHIPKSP